MKSTTVSNCQFKTAANKTFRYEVLGDPAKRSRYDCCGMEGVKGEMQSGRDMEMTISVSLEELYSGAHRKDTVRRRVVCRR